MKKCLCLALALLLILCCACGHKTDYRALLAEYSDFNREDAVDVFFIYGAPDDPAPLAQLEAKWGLRAIAGEGDSLSRALNLMHWLCSHTHKVSDCPYEGETNAARLLNYSFDSEENGLNCRYYAIAFSEILQAAGITAKALYCYPGVYRDNHVVVRAWLDDEDRWVMLDPSFDLYVMDEAGHLLDAREIRENLAANIPMHWNKDTTWNGNGYLDYLAEDLFYFECMQDTRYGRADAEDNESIYLLPVGATLDSDAVLATYNTFWE